MCSFFFYIIVEIQLSRGEGWGKTVTGLTPPYFCACLKSAPEFPTSYVVVFLCSVKTRGDCSFCHHDIGGIDDHHCWSFLFISEWGIRPLIQWFITGFAHLDLISRHVDKTKKAFQLFSWYESIFSAFKYMIWVVIFHFNIFAHLFGEYLWIFKLCYIYISRSHS